MGSSRVSLTTYIALKAPALQNKYPQAKKNAKWVVVLNPFGGRLRRPMPLNTFWISFCCLREQKVMLDHGVSVHHRKLGVEYYPNRPGEIITILYAWSTQIGGKSQQHFCFIGWMEKDSPFCEWKERDNLEPVVLDVILCVFFSKWKKLFICTQNTSPACSAENNGSTIRSWKMVSLQHSNNHNERCYRKNRSKEWIDRPSQSVLLFKRNL